MIILRKLINAYYKNRFQKRATCRIGPESSVNFRRIAGKRGVLLDIGKDSLVDGAIWFDRDSAAVLIGERTFIGASTLVCAERIEIGDDVLISWGCTIVDHNSHAIDWESRKSDVVAWSQGKKDWARVTIKPIRINDKAWIGLNAIILKGVTIGEGAVVAAGSVVTKDVPPYTLVAGNPARIIRKILLDER